MPNNSPQYLLDTHIWLWWVTDDASLDQHAVAQLEQAARQGGLCVSAISAWEIAMLERRGRISLGRTCTDWLDIALHEAGIELLPFTPAIAVESTRLPGSPHGDPADRIIMATARIHGATLVTRDHAILDYGAAGHVTVFGA